MGLLTVRDLLLYYPRTYEDKSSIKTLAQMSSHEISTVRGNIYSVHKIPTRSHVALIKGSFVDSDGNEAEVVWFGQKYLTRYFTDGQDVLLSGKLTVDRYGHFQLKSPTFEDPKEEQIHLGRIVPIYPESELINSKWLREKIRPLLCLAKDFPENLPAEIIKEEGLLPHAQAITEVHFPTSLDLLNKARYRLAFEELFFLQKQNLERRAAYQAVPKSQQKAVTLDSQLIKEFLASFSFTPTNAQKIAIYEILKDLERPVPMYRLLSGDVGSGKTLVAVAAILNTVKAGYQAVIMAPTEVLANQHYQSITRLLKPYGFNIQLLKGSLTEKQKKQIATSLSQGTVDIVTGTHALIQENIKFKKLGLVIVDEQHRFGVEQRAHLKDHGHPHYLAMTATPIPRTLALTLYGDQDISVLDEMPSGRQTIITRVVPPDKRRQAYLFVEDQIKKGRQAFIICPLIDESDILEVKSAINEHKHLQEEIFPDLSVGLLHGKMKPKEKDEIMDKFKNQEINILVSTSVIEVGIDIPNATMMLIEGAERFGLAQLHQFRGRVGRSEYQSYCLLFPSSPDKSIGQRLQAMVKYHDGFKLAEIDLKLRGMGEIYGTKQSGLPDLKMADFTDQKLLKKTRMWAEKVIGL